MPGTPWAKPFQPRTKIGRPGPAKAAVATKACRRISASTPPLLRWPALLISSSTSATTSCRHRLHQPCCSRACCKRSSSPSGSRRWPGNPRAARLSSSDSAVAGGSSSTQAERLSKLTLASCTPGWARRRFSTALTQPPHFMPSISRSSACGAMPQARDASPGRLASQSTQRQLHR